MPERWKTKIVQDTFDMRKSSGYHFIYVDLIYCGFCGNDNIPLSLVNP